MFPPFAFNNWNDHHSYQVSTYGTFLIDHILFINSYNLKASQWNLSLIKDLQQTCSAINLVSLWRMHKGAKEWDMNECDSSYLEPQFSNFSKFPFFVTMLTHLYNSMPIQLAKFQHRAFIIYSSNWSCEWSLFSETALPPLRKPKTCFRFPLDGLAFTTYLQMVTSLLRISNLVMHVSLKKLPPSKVPDEIVGSSENNLRTENITAFPWIRLDASKQDKY